MQSDVSLNTSDCESGEQLHKELMAAHPEHLAGQLARLQALDAGGAQNRQAVIAQAKQVVASVDIAPLLAFYGTKTDTRSDAAKIKTQVGILGRCSQIYILLD